MTTVRGTWRGPRHWREAVIGPGLEVALMIAALLVSIPTWPHFSPLWALALATVLAVGGGGVSGFRPRAGAACVAASLVVTILALNRMPIPSVVGAMVAVFALVSRDRYRVAALASAAYAALLTAHYGRDSGVGGLVALAGLAVVVMLAPWLLGAAVRSARRDSGTRTADRLKAERAEIANDLHDYVTHDLSVMVLYAEQAQLRTGTDPDLAFIAATARRCNTNARQLMSLLAQGQPTSVDHGESLTDALAAARAQLQEHGFAVNVVTELDDRLLSRQAEETLARLLREAAHNVVEHGDPQKPASIMISVDEDTVDLAVLNGIGHAAGTAEGHGIRSLEQRVQAFGGHLEARASGDRWLLHAVIPSAIDAATPFPAREVAR